MRKLIAGAAIVGALVIPATAASASTGARPAATPACSTNCFDLSSLQLGRSEIQNAYVPGDTGVGEKVGQDVNLNTGSNSHPNMDWTGAKVGTLADFCPEHGGVGLAATAYVCITYPSFWPVFESDFSPFGNESGLCAGAVLPVTSGENVKLEACGTDATTLWVGDLANSTNSHGHVYFPWVNGASTTFSHQLDLSVDTGTAKPVNQLKLASLNKLTGGTVPDTQQFTFVQGPVK